MAGTIGECAVYDLEGECNCNQAVGILTIDHGNNISAKYLVKCLNSRIAQLQFGKLQKIADQPNIGFVEIKSIKIPYPPTKKEQEGIVNQVKQKEDQLPVIDKMIESEKELTNNILPRELGIVIPENIQKRDYFF